ncbi:MAG: HEAT repeat domain-containing protein [Methyloligellaceae bacterium]
MMNTDKNTPHTYNFLTIAKIMLAVICFSTPINTTYANKSSSLVTFDTMRVMSGRYNPADTPILIKHLKSHQEFYMRAYAANILARYKKEEVVGPLLKALNDEHQEVRIQATLSLAKLQVSNPKIKANLTEALSHKSHAIKTAAAIFLGNKEIINQVNEDKKLLSSPDKARQFDAAEKLFHNGIPDPRIKDIFVRMARSKDLGRAERAARRLKQFAIKTPEIKKAIKDFEAADLANTFSTEGMKPVK